MKNSIQATGLLAQAPAPSVTITITRLLRGSVKKSKKAKKAGSPGTSVQKHLTAS